MRLTTAVGVCVLLAGCTQGGGEEELPEITRTEVELLLPPEASPPEPAPIESISVDEPANIEVRYSTGTPGCYSLARVEIAYRADRIEVKVFDARTVGDDVFCTQELLVVSVKVALSQPIAGREVVPTGPRSAVVP